MPDLMVAGVKNIDRNTKKLPSLAPEAPGSGTIEDTMVTNACAHTMLTGEASVNPNAR